MKRPQNLMMLPPKFGLPKSSSSSSSRATILSFVVLMSALGCCVTSSASYRPWESAGCHRVGHTRTVSIPGCVPFQVTLRACRGYCVSYAIPSPVVTLSVNPNHIITSRAECCGIVDTTDVSVLVSCRNGYQLKHFKSARSCSCSVCRRE